MPGLLEKIHFLVTVQGVFLAVPLLLRRPRTAAGVWLAFFILLVSAETLQMYVLETGLGGHLCVVPDESNSAQNAQNIFCKYSFNLISCDSQRFF